MVQRDSEGTPDGIRAMTVLVTGATGFIGRVLVERLAASHGSAAVICLVCVLAGIAVWWLG